MDLAALIDYINLHIKPNGNREITANVLNPVLQAITEWANNQMGDLEDLNTTEKANLVAAINEVNNALAAININGSQVYYGTANPNVTPPPVFKAGDFYVQEDLFNVTVALFVYDGFTWRNLSGGNVGDPIRVWAQGDARIILKDQTYVNANFDAFGIGINNEVGWKIADFPNCVPVQQGSGVFANLGDTVGSKDAVNVSHSHNSAELSDGKKGVNALGTGTNTAGYILVEDAATAKIVKTSTEGVDGTDKNIQPSYVVLYVECLQDIWASGGGTTPNLTQVLAIDNKTNDIPIVSNNGKAAVDVNDDYTALSYGPQSFAMTDTEVQLYSEVPVTFDSNVSTDFNTPVLNYNTEEIATKNWVTTQGYGTGTPSTLISTDADNALTVGTDSKLFVPESTGTGTVTSVTGVDGETTVATGTTTPVIGISSTYTSARDAYADAKVADTINNGTTTIAPSQNAVFDALDFTRRLITKGTGSVTGTVSETILTTLTIPANTLDSSCFIWTTMAFSKNSAGSVTTRLYINNANTLTGATLLGFVTGASNRNVDFNRKFLVNGTSLDLLTGSTISTQVSNEFVENLYAASTVLTINPSADIFLIYTTQNDATGTVATNKMATVQKMKL